MLILRSALFAFAFYGATAIFTILGSPLLLGPRRWAMAGLALHARVCLWLLRVIAGTRYEIRGRENIPRGAALVAAKHQSTWETFALIPFLSDPAMIMKAELGLIPFYGWFARKFEHILVARERGPAALKSMISQAKERARQGRQIVIFPEGTRRTPGAPPDYKPGIVALYEALGAPCVPVALNSGVYWPPRGFIRRPGTIVVEFLPPIPAGVDRKAFRREIEAAIETATVRLVEEACLAEIRPLTA